MPPNDEPGSFSMMKQVMPSGVFAASATSPARSPFVTHIFVPLRMYSLPSGRPPHPTNRPPLPSPVGHRLAPDRLRVASCVGLGQGERSAHLTGRHLRQPARLLLGGAELLDQR